MGEASDRNKGFYEKVWGNRSLYDFRIWSTWSIVKELAPGRALEIGCGNKPRIPVVGNYFLDINRKAVDRLSKAGANASVFDLVARFPYKNGQFDLVCAFEVLEHLENDGKILSELGRVLSKRGTALISFPLNMRYWVDYDLKVGHVRRYEPKELTKFFEGAGLVIKKYAPIDVAWPNRWQSAVLSFLVEKFPRLMVAIQSWLESQEASPLRTELSLKTWTGKSESDLRNETTALFVLKRK